MADTRPDPNLSDRLDFTVDAEAEPVDVDESLAVFLLAFVRESEGSER